jgi:betaine-aldehyde dehydrogenase
MKGHWIDNMWVAGETEGFIEVRNPATEEVLDRVSSGSVGDAQQAVESAKTAFAGWRKAPAIERAALLHEASTKMRTNWSDLVNLLTLEEGKPLSENEEELEWVAGTFDYYAELGRHYRGRVLPSPEPDNQLNLVLKEPYGVVGCIVPWNYPLLLLAWKIAPALAAGNTVVIKQSEMTPFDQDLL